MRRFGVTAKMVLYISGASDAAIEESIFRHVDSGVDSDRLVLARVP